MRYFGFEDQSHDFWGDLTSMNARPLGWCKKEGKELVPPEGVPPENVTQEKIEEALKNAKAVPAQLLSGVSPRYLRAYRLSFSSKLMLSFFFNYRMALHQPRGSRQG